MTGKPQVNFLIADHGPASSYELLSVNDGITCNKPEASYLVSAICYKDIIAVAHDGPLWHETWSV